MALNNTNDTNGMNKEERLEWANGELERAKKLYEKGEYQESIKICEDILPIFEKMETIDEYRDCINYCYVNLKAIRNYEKSLQLGTEVLKNISTKLRQDKRLTAITYNNFGSCHNNLGNQNKAIKYHKQALAIYNKDKIKYQANIAYTNYCLANCFFCQTKYKKAIEKLGLALKNFEKDGRDKNIVYFSMVFNLMGMSYLRIGNIKKALCYFEKSLDIRVKLYGHKHPDIAEICGNLGVCFYEKRDYDTAALYLNISNTNIKYSKCV